MSQLKQAEAFAGMHKKGRFFVLPNGWNGGSARVFQEAGFAALGTTSAGIAYAMGLPDGERVPLEELVRITREICRAVKIPLSVDMERGYGRDAGEVKAAVRRVVEAGAVGINIEDGLPGGTPLLNPLAAQTELIGVLKDLKREMGIPFVINARSCAVLLGAGDGGRSPLEEALRRGEAFARAGADAVFLPGPLTEEEAVRAVREIPLPLNLLLTPRFHDMKALAEMEVVRLSTGSAPVRKVLAELIGLGADLQRREGYERIFDHPFSYDRANDFFAPLPVDSAAG